MNHLPDASPEEQELSELKKLWLLSDPEESLSKFLRISCEELTAYMRGSLTAAEVLKMYHERH